MPSGSFLSSGSSINPSIAWVRGRRGGGRFHITFPLDSTWYREQACTRFRSLQHRKERNGLFRHEFIVLELENKSICRIERMGDPNASFDAISPQGIVAYDFIQSFPSDKDPEACLGTSDVVAEITFPPSLDLKLVLHICRAIQEGERTSNYTLQVFNCYFFALAVQAALTRFVASWRHAFTAEIWNSGLEKGLSDLSDLYKTVALARNQRPFLLSVHSALLPDTQWPAEDLIYKLKREFPQLEEVSKLCDAILWHSDTSLAVDHVLCRRVRDAVIGISNDQLHHLADQRPCTNSAHIPPLRSIVVQFKNLISRAISRHDKGFQTSRLRSIDPGPQPQLRLAHEFESFLFEIHRKEEWTMDLRPSNPQSHSDPPQPHPDPPRPRPGSLQLHQDSPQPHSDSPKLQRDPSKPGPNLPQSSPDPPQLNLDPAPKPHTGLFQSTILSLSFKASQLYVWLTYAGVLALWAFQLVLGLFWIAQPALCMSVEGELESNLATLNKPGQRSPEELASISRTLVSLMDAPELVVQWDEWPWDHVYRPIRRHILESLARSETQVLEVSFKKGTSGTKITLSKFQEHLLKRIRDHATRVESFWLGSAAEIQDEMVVKISQVWALIRFDDVRLELPSAFDNLGSSPFGNFGNGQGASLDALISGGFNAAGHMISSLLNQGQTPTTFPVMPHLGPTPAQVPVPPPPPPRQGYIALLVLKDVEGSIPT